MNRTVWPLNLPAFHLMTGLHSYNYRGKDCSQRSLVYEAPQTQPPGDQYSSGHVNRMPFPLPISLTWTKPGLSPTRLPKMFQCPLQKFQRVLENWPPPSREAECHTMLYEREVNLIIPCPIWLLLFTHLFQDHIRLM